MYGIHACIARNHADVIVPEYRNEPQGAGSKNDVVSCSMCMGSNYFDLNLAS